MVRGIFITFEGPDGSGKTTQIRQLSSFLSRKGFEIYETREPGGTAVSEKIRDILLDPEHRELSAAAETLLYAASRAQLVDEKIRPALEAGKVVICDRFVDSSLAYQGGARKLGEVVRRINDFATGGILPNLTFLLLLDPEEGMARATGRQELDRIELENAEFHRAVYEAYLQLAEKEPERVICVDATGSVEAIQAAIQKRVERLLERQASEEEDEKK